MHLAALCVFGDLQYKDFGYQINVIAVVRNIEETFMQVQILSGLASSIKKISLYYLLLLPGINNEIQFYLYPQFFNPYYNFTNTSLPSTHIINIQLPDIDLTGGATSVAFLSGINVAQTKDSGQLQFILESQMKSTSKVILKISSPARAALLIYILVSIIVYNNAFTYDSSLHFHVHPGSISFQNFSFTTYTNKDLKLTNLNTFIGLTGFKISNQDTFSFFYSMDSPNSISVNANNYFDYIAFAFVVFTSDYCDYTVPYYEEASKRCYSVCPGTTSPDNTSLSCVCYVDKLQVNNSNCNPSPIKQYPNISIQTIVIISLAIFGGAMVLIVVASLKKINSFKRFKRELANQIQLQSDHIVEPEKEGHNMSIETQSIEKNSQGHKNHRLWKKADISDSFEHLCCLCEKKKAFFKLLCLHSFHISCILQLVDNEKKCAECQKNIQNQGRFYCRACNNNYLIVKIDRRTLGNLEDLEQLCDSCKNIQL